MATLVLILHYIACVMLIGIILMQNGKGSSAGIFGSANSDSVFAGPSAATFITKLTAGIAIFIMFTSIFLTAHTSRQGMSSVVDKVAAIPAREIPPQNE